jgi:hypothetical protein
LLVKVIEVARKVAGRTEEEDDGCEYPEWTIKIRMITSIFKEVLLPRG